MVELVCSMIIRLFWHWWDNFLFSHWHTQSHTNIWHISFFLELIFVLSLTFSLFLLVCNWNLMVFFLSLLFDRHPCHAFEFFGRKFKLGKNHIFITTFSPDSTFSSTAFNSYSEKRVSFLSLPLHLGVTIFIHIHVPAHYPPYLNKS